MPRGKKKFSRALLNKLPEHGLLFLFYRPMKVSRRALQNWTDRENLPMHLTRRKHRILIRSELIAWMEKTKRIKK